MKQYLTLMIFCVLLSSCSTTTIENQQEARTSNTISANNNSPTTGITTNSQDIMVPESTETPMENCTWKTYISKKFHLGFQYQECTGSSPVHFVEKDSTLWYGDMKFMEIQSKQANETNVEALKRLYFSRLSTQQQKNCRISTNSMYSTAKQSSVERYEIEEKPGIAKEENYPGEYCGDHGLTNGMRYFEFQKGSSIIVFLDLGQDPAWFGRDTLTFTKQ